MSRVSGRDLILYIVSKKKSKYTEKGYFANVLDAALAMTAFARFCIAVIASISCSAVGGNRIFSLRSGTIVSHGGNW
jgi:hypothetical protein